MKLLVVIALVVIAPTILAAQSPTRERRSTDSEKSDSTSGRQRVVSSRVANHAENRKTSPASNSADSSTASEGNGSQLTWGNTSVIIRPNDQGTALGSQAAAVQPMVESTGPSRQLIQSTSLEVAAAPKFASPSINYPSPNSASPLYKVGAGDVLDVRLANLSTRESTLYTVLKNGTLEYPLVGGPISVVGMTTDEIANLLSREVKVISSARVTVSVRDYASHTVVVTGLVDNPGRKILRREAVPLFVILAEAQVRSEATAAIISRNAKDGAPLSLKDDSAMASLIQKGDVIRVVGNEAGPQQFVYIGGDVASPGEKAFREGMTLTQALLSAGGVSRSIKAVVRVVRRNNSGFLSTNEYRLRAIDEGKSPDPLIQPGDRIEVASDQ